jgi:transposase
MAKKLDPMDIKQIIRLQLEGTSNREIAKVLGIGRNTVNSYIQKVKACDLSFEDVLKLDEQSIKELFPSKTTIDNQRFDTLIKYFEKVNLARNHPGFTFLHHYDEYKKSVANPYSYTQFLEHYNQKYKKINGSMKLDHKAGAELMIDYAGSLLEIVNKETGEITPVQVFVAILPCSQYVYVEACLSQKREDLITCIANSLSFIGGVPKAIVSDNLKAAVTRACKYEPVINKSLKDFALHYGCVINPTRSYSPQDKALVENAVNLVYQRIYYPIREMTFYSLRDLNLEIKERLASFNDMLFQRKEASRKELFQSTERRFLKPLPERQYELKEYCRAKVQKIGYIFFSPDKSYYSVPYRYIGKNTQVHYSQNWVEIYHNYDRIAIHKRTYEKGLYTTIKDHLASTHQVYKDWSPEYFKNKAKEHGEFVMLLIQKIMWEEKDYPELAYKRALGIINLHKKYGSDRLNNACQRALNGNALSYYSIKNILESGLDKESLNLEQLNEHKSHIPKHSNIRGANGIYKNNES